METKEFAIDPKWFDLDDDSNEIRQAFLKSGVRTFLEEQGLVFPKGAYATFDRERNVLPVRHNGLALQSIGWAVELLQPIPEPVDIGPPYIVEGPPKPESFPLHKKLRELVLPSITFDRANVRTAVKELKRMSVELDISEEPVRRGVNIIVKSDATVADGSPEAIPTPAEKLITFAASQVTLLNALEAIAKQAEMKLREEPYRAVLVPLHEPEPLVTKSYLLPSSKFLPRSPASPEDKLPENRSFLESRRVTLPIGSSAIYSPRTQQLTVRATESRHLEVQEAVIKAWADYIQSLEREAVPSAL